MVEQILIALLSIIGLTRIQERQCVESHHNDIVRYATEASQSTGVPPSVILVVALLETHFGCANGSGTNNGTRLGNWGSPADRFHRHTAGTPYRTAEDLSHSYNACHTWFGAVSRYRCGLCRCPPPPHGGYTASYAVGLMRQTEEMANVTNPPTDFSIPRRHR
jgi:hypothetical protein